MAKVLTSWKEIAVYLGKGVRTVQRWEMNFGLPVRRPKSDSHKAVLAIPEELNEWLLKRTENSTSTLETLRKELQANQKEIVRLRRENTMLRRRIAESAAIQSHHTAPSDRLRSQTDGGPPE